MTIVLRDPSSVPLDHKVAEPVCHSDNSVAGPPMLLWQQCCGALLVSPCPSTIFGACNSRMQRTLQFKIWTKSCPKPLELAIIQGRAHHAMCTCWVLVCTHMCCHLPPQTVTSKHWRRIYTEEKAKVVAAAWGYNIYLIPCRTRMIWKNEFHQDERRKGWIHPFLQLVLGQNSYSVAGNGINSVPQIAATTSAFSFV